MRASLRAVLVLVCALLSAACPSSYVAVPLAAHPTASTAGPNVGASLGGIVGVAEGENFVSLPYSEGWLRLGAGAGQFDLHMGPGVSSVGYRFDLQPMTTGFGFAVEPFGGGGFYRQSAGTVEVEGESSEALYSLILAGGLRVHLLMPTATGYFYISPVLGITHFETNDDVEIDDLITFGTAVGISLGGRPGTSLELAVHRLSPSEDFGTDLWMFGPSVGFQL